MEILYQDKYNSSTESVELILNIKKINKNNPDKMQTG